MVLFSNDKFSNVKSVHVEMCAKIHNLNHDTDTAHSLVDTSKKLRNLHHFINLLSRHL